MNELDLLLAEIVEASRQRRQKIRASANGGRRDKIDLARVRPRPSAFKVKAASA